MKISIISSIISITVQFEMISYGTKYLIKYGTCVFMEVGKFIKIGDREGVE